MVRSVVGVWVHVIFTLWTQVAPVLSVDTSISSGKDITIEEVRSFLLSH